MADPRTQPESRTRRAGRGGERADDLVWRVKFRNEWLYLYLLLGFQSTVHRFMAVRLLTFVGLYPPPP